MELQEFISESLSQIINGIEDAQAKLKDQTKFHPVIYHPGQNTSPAFNVTEHVEFEVIVNAESGSSASAGGKINVFSLSIGAGAEDISKNTQMNKIKFSVPISFCRGEPNKK